MVMCRGQGWGGQDYLPWRTITKKYGGRFACRSRLKNPIATTYTTYIPATTKPGSIAAQEITDGLSASVSVLNAIDPVDAPAGDPGTLVGDATSDGVSVLNAVANGNSVPPEMTPFW